MIKIVAQNLHAPDKLPDEIMKATQMLVSIAKSIQETAQSGAYSLVRGELERAVRELQYLDRMIDEHYGEDMPGTPLHERAGPNSNYLLNPQFHS
jgi:hypothetical protein